MRLVKPGFQLPYPLTLRDGLFARKDCTFSGFIFAYSGKGALKYGGSASFKILTLIITNFFFLIFPIRLTYIFYRSGTRAINFANPYQSIKAIFFDKNGLIN